MGQKKQNERFASSACASTPATWTTHTTLGHWSVYVTDIRAWYYCPDNRLMMLACSDADDVLRCVARHALCSLCMRVRDHADGGCDNLCPDDSTGAHLHDLNFSCYRGLLLRGLPHPSKLGGS